MRRPTSTLPLPRSLGFTIDQSPRDQPWGMRDAVILNTDGNRVVVGAEIVDADSA